MSEDAMVVQKVEWFQFRMTDGRPFFVLVSSLPNGFFTALPVEVALRNGDHTCIGLAASSEEALDQLQKNLAGKSYEEIFPAGHP